MPILPKVFILLICSHIFNLTAQAGGWPQPKGSYYFKISEWWIVSDQHFNNQGQIEANLVQYGYYATSLYGEYGFSNRLTGLVHFPFLNYTYTQLPSTLQKQSIWRTGDADIGIKYGLNFNKPIAWSASLILGFPLGYNEGDALMTGDGEFNQALRLEGSGGFRLKKNEGWAGVYTGYNRRSGDFTDEMIFGVEAGINTSNDRLTFTIRLDGIKAIGNDPNATSVNPQSLFSNYKEYLGLSPEIALHMSPSWGITIGAGTAFYGKNIFASPSFAVGVFHKKGTVPVER